MSKKREKGRPVDWTPAKRKKLGESLIKFCKQDHVFHFVQWTRDQGKAASWWRDLCRKYEDLDEYHRMAKEILGGKIVQLAFENGNNWAIQTFLPKYLDDVKEYLRADEEAELDRRMRLEKYKNSLNQAKEEEAGAKIEGFDKSQEMAYELIRLRKFIEEKGLAEELENGQDEADV